MLLERDFQAAIIDYAAHMQWRIYHHSRSDKGLRGGPTAIGLPDLLLVKDCYPASNLLIAAELKCGKRTTTPEQREWLRYFDGVDGAVGVLWRPTPAPLNEPWLLRVETWEGDNLGAIGQRLRGEPND